MQSMRSFIPAIPTLLLLGSLLQVPAAPISHWRSRDSSQLSTLFPMGDGLEKWTTLHSADGAVPLSDETFRPHDEISALPHPYVQAPDSDSGDLAMQAHYPKGSYTYTHQPQGGISFYAPGPASVDVSTASEVTFGYSVYFPKGFQFNKGGKLPGIYGGDSDSIAVGCSGGRRDTKCFSARLMWREDGMGEMYTYLPPGIEANKKICDYPPDSDCNDTYGASIARGSFTFADGAWTTVVERIKLNDPGQENGELQMWANGKQVIDISGLVLVDDSGEGAMRGIQMQTFFGGHDDSFASPADQDTYFKDFSLSILAKK